VVVEGDRQRGQRMPAGPAVIITPWNAPWLLSTWKLAPALAAGNTVILKPAEWAPLSASLLADLAAEAGHPAGVLNIVQGIGDEAGRRWSPIGGCAGSRSPGLRRRPSHRTAAARNMVPVHRRTGRQGAVPRLRRRRHRCRRQKAAGQYDDSGQVCLAGTRLLVEDSISGRVPRAVPRLHRRHVLGRQPQIRSTTISPMIHPDHLARVEGFVSGPGTTATGCVRRAASGRRTGSGTSRRVIEPISNDSEVVQREIFGPVLTFQTFSDEAEAIALANSTRYGLSGSSTPSSAERAHRVGRRPSAPAPCGSTPSWSAT
jgi:acyl-CoA reductase-like NAD-dependent aldehyde dehydrogenase